MPGPIYKPLNIDSAALASKLPEPLQWWGGAALEGLKALVGAGGDPGSEVVGSLAPAPLMAAFKEAPAAAQGLKRAILPMDEASRMGRAEAQGFTTPVYHGTRHDFREFDPAISDLGVHVTPHPETAATAITGYNLPGYHNTGARIMPLQARMNKTLSLRDVGLWTNPDNWVRTYGNTESVNMVGKPTEMIPNLENLTNDPEAIKAIYDEAMKYYGKYEHAPNFPADVRNILQQRGYDSVEYPNFIEGSGEPSYMLLDPRNIRSKFAAFDPAKLGKTKDILASGAPLLALKSLLSKDEQ